MAAQEADIIIIDGKRYDLFTNPFEMYREKHRRDIIFRNEVPVTLSMLFGTEDKQSAATWYSSELRVPQGEMTKYVHAVYGKQMPPVPDYSRC